MRAIMLALTVSIAAPPEFGWAQTAAPSQAEPAIPEVVATAAGAPAAPTQPADPQLTRWLKQAPPVSDDSGVIAQAPPRGVHGEVGIGVGSNGYRDVYAAASVPVGKASEVDVAVDDAQLSRPFKVNARSLAIGVNLGGAGGGPPADCDSAIRVGDHYVEPLWVTRFRGAPLADADPRCVSAAPSK